MEMKIVIVDDEPLVRKGIISMFSVSFPEIEVVGEAGNGETAKQIIKDCKPDLVLTDIVMPKTDGIELIKWMLAYMPQTKAVVLSCHQDFDFVKKAFIFGAVDYILKYDVDEESFRQVLEKVQNILQNQNQPTVTDIDEKVVLKSDIELMKSALLKEMLFSKIVDEGRTIQKCADFGMGVNIIEPARIACIEVDSVSCDKVKDRTHFVIELFSVIKQVLRGLLEFELYYEGNYRMYMVFQPDVEHGTYDEILRIIEQLQRFIKRYFSVTISCGISTEYHNFKHYPKMREQAVNALEKKFFAGQESVCFFGNIDNNPNSMENEIKSLKTRIVDDISQERFSKAVGLEGDLYHLLQAGKGYTVMQAKLLYISFLERFLTSFDDGDYNINAINKEIISFEFLCMLHDYVVKLIAELADRRVGIINTKGCSQGIKKTVSYINMYFAEREINLESISQHCGYTPSYLSRLFKQETGRNIVDYLNEIRIYNAKLLLQKPKSKVYQVAENVGYNNYNYFSKMFKKFEGISPSEYSV